MKKRRNPIEGDDIIILYDDNTEAHARVECTLDTMFIAIAEDKDVFLYYDPWKGTKWTYMEPTA